MVAAAEMAREYRYPLFLGDQGIDDTSKRLKESFLESLSDLVTLQWIKLAREIRKSYVEAVYVGGNSSGTDYLGYSDFFSMRLLMYVPVSLIRYPLALILKAPKFSLALLSVLFLVSMIDPTDVSTPLTSTLSAFGIDVGDQISPTAEAVTSMMTSFLILVGEIALLGRPFLTVLLAERNNIIAKNILTECNRLSEKRATGGDEREKTVVSVLGMAHCNGIKKILTERI
jgi:pheromone shutdown protein TraB